MRRCWRAEVVGRVLVVLLGVREKARVIVMGRWSEEGASKRVLAERRERRAVGEIRR